MSSLREKFCGVTELVVGAEEVEPFVIMALRCARLMDGWGTIVREGRAWRW